MSIDPEQFYLLERWLHHNTIYIQKMIEHIKIIFITALLIILFVSCDESTRESDRAVLYTQKREIISLANSGQCTANSECKFIGIGSKPCGGPWNYIVYSTSIDTQRLFRMITQYDQNEDSYNRKWGLASDCSMAPAPDSVGCLDGRCAMYRNGKIY